MININNILPEDNKLTDFEKMIMKWTAFDHYCPSIKAEVIWDMMLSEFIVDMVAYTYREKYREQYTADNFYLLAKEFPIKTKDDSLMAAKADYLVASKKDKKIIIVELKSTPGSFSQDQSDRYERCKPDEMFKFYNELISKEVGPSLYYEKEPIEWVKSQKYAGQIAYMYQQYAHNVAQLDFELEDSRRSYVKRFHSAFINQLEEEYVNLDLIYLYVVSEEPDITNCSGNNRKAKGELSVRMDVKKVYPMPKEDAQENRYCKIYPNEKFMNFLDENQEGINKKMAWTTFCKLIDAVDHYKEDFEETKKKYEPYHRD